MKVKIIAGDELVKFTKVLRYVASLSHHIMLEASPKEIKFKAMPFSNTFLLDFSYSICSDYSCIEEGSVIIRSGDLYQVLKDVTKGNQVIIIRDGGGC